ncbi:MAG: CehA/McbA family metallohydrolase [Planctomycetes bacterium]|nr:CehA/McbA family metallohydrolase [Planctomycetota bacterium]
MPTLSHPYADLSGGRWLRGNLHTHTNHSDGQRPPQEVIDDYAKRGYDFLMISDHDLFTSDEHLRQWDARGMVMIPGNEITAQGPHLLHVDADRFVSPLRQRQEIINTINAAAAQGGRGFVIVNHPNWFAGFDHCSIEQMREWVGYVGMEIFNGTIGRLDGSPYATNKWDMLLNQGRRIWGFANDDHHLSVGDIELGWNMAYVKERCLAGVIDTLKKGRFYASTGVTIDSIAVDGMNIRIRADNAVRIVALRDTARRFAIADGPEISVTVPEGAKYVRFECWGQGERFAWTQPFFVEA